MTLRRCDRCRISVDRSTRDVCPQCGGPLVEPGDVDEDDAFRESSKTEKLPAIPKRDGDD
jgi:hypothetical protein